MRRLRFPIIPEGRPIYLTAHPHSLRGEIIARGQPLECLRQTRRSAVMGSGDVEFSVPKSALVSTNYPDILAVQNWFKVPDKALSLVA